MDRITTDELKNLFVRYRGWCVSLFMPTHRAGREREQGPIRLKNLLRQAEESLLAKGLRPRDVKEMLKPAQDLLDEPPFWQYQSDGLAVFCTPETFRTYRLPLPFEELVVISNHFHFKPLLPFFAGDGRFYILALSRNQVRLLEGTRDTVDEVDIKSVFPALAEALHYEAPERQLQFHTGTTSAKTGDRAAVYHGHDPSDEDKAKILRWFRKIDDELSGVLTDRPVVLAGVEYLFPLYKEVNSYPHLVGDGITGNPEKLRPEELHAQAWPLVQPIFIKAQEEAAVQYGKIVGTGLTTTSVEEAVSAAHLGRVGILFVATGVQVWGNFDPETLSAHIHETPEPGDVDLLNLAAVQSILHGGKVYAVSPEEVPDRGSLAAVFRY